MALRVIFVSKWMWRVVLWCVLPTLNVAVGQEADAAKDSLAGAVPKCRFHTPAPLRGTPPILGKELNSIAVQLFTKIGKMAEGRRGISFIFLTRLCRGC